MIVQNRITIEDADHDQCSFVYDEADPEGFFLVDSSDTRVLGLTMEDAAALVVFFKRFGVSA